MIALHFIPIRVLLLAWGIIKFSKRIIRPHAVTNNEVLDFLSRVPDDEEMVKLNSLQLCAQLLMPFSLQYRFSFVKYHYNSQRKQHAAMHERKRSNHRIMSFTFRLILLIAINIFIHTYTKTQTNLLPFPSIDRPQIVM